MEEALDMSLDSFYALPGTQTLAMAEDGGLPSRAVLASRFRSNSEHLMRVHFAWNSATPATARDSGSGRESLTLLAARLLSVSDHLQRQQHVSISTSTSLNGGTTGGVAPASKEAIEALKEVDVAVTGDVDQLPAECAICLHGQDAAAAEAVARWKEMPCGHWFHGVCLVKWLRVHGTCPMCRHQIDAIGGGG
uniref:RING-type domain-containing protein n=1 Tax=Oryza punctata TaxID=4537 RepID=A0A0E0KEC9_ORYPU